MIVVGKVESEFQSRDPDFIAFNVENLFNRKAPTAAVRRCTVSA